MTEEELKTKPRIDPALYVSAVFHIGCTDGLGKYREVLSAIRDLLKDHDCEKQKHWFNCTCVAQVINCISASLVRVDKKKTGVAMGQASIKLCRKKLSHK